MGQHAHWRHACAALAICMLLACTGCTGQDASADKQDAEASHTAGETPAAEGVTPVSKPKGGDAGEAAAAAAAASNASNHQTADGVGKAAKARGKAAASVSGKSASRPQKGALKAGLRGKDLDAALKKAVHAVKRHQAADAVVSQLVEEAPAAELAHGIDDIDPTGSCREAMEAFCLGVEPGERRLANCLQHQLDQEAMPGLQPGDNKWSDQCRTELAMFFIDDASSINKNLPLARACKKDIKRRCKDVQDGHGEVTACLRSQPERLTQKCYNEVFLVELGAADDIRQDPQLWAACKADTDKHCKKAKFEKGRVQQCLRRHRMALDWTCRAQLFRQAMENADDIRKSSYLFQLCLRDKKRFCRDVPPGHMRAIDCLEMNRHESDFSPGCRDALEVSIAERAADFRLDASLRAACSKDIERRCGVDDEIVLDPVQSEEGVVINCLQDYRDELRAPECQAAVHRAMQRGAEDIRFNVRLGNACAEDRSSLCGDIKPGSARVIRCLQSKRKQLSNDCRAAMFDEETLMGESIDFQVPMTYACSRELHRWCWDVPHAHARAIRCLQDHQEQPGFGQSCREELVRHEEHAATDYRLNARLASACSSSMQELCAGVHCKEHEICGGAMLRCLTDKAENITVPDCQHEVQYYLKMGVESFRNDPILADACRADVDKYCPKTQPGHGRINRCLRGHIQELTPACRAEQQRLIQVTSDSFTMQPSLAADCAAEREEHCADVRPGSSRIYNCLLATAENADFSARCRDNLAAQQPARLADWRLDHNLRTACRVDAPQLCAEAMQAKEPKGEVLQCLVNALGMTSSECSRETVRAVHTGLQFYRPGLPVISACDKDAQKFCMSEAARKARPLSGGLLDAKGKHGALGQEAAAAPVGQIRGCLAEHRMSVDDHGGLDAMMADIAGNQSEPELLAGGRRRLRQDSASTPGSEGIPDDPTHAHATGSGGGGMGDRPKKELLSGECQALVALGDVPSFEDFEATLQGSRLVSQLSRLQSALNLPPDTFTQVKVADTPSGPEMKNALTLTGWGAIAGMFALAAVVLGAVVLGWKRYIDSRYGGYEVVMKRPPRGERSVEMH